MAAAVAVEFWGESYDDSFITYRYARNLIEGEGFVYNPGERVVGTTAPGLAFLLAAITALGKLVGLDVPTTGTLLSLAALLLAARWLARRCGLVVGALYGLLALTFPWHLELLGAEGFLVVALVLLTHERLARGGRRQQARAGLLAAAAVAVRPTAAIAIVLLYTAALLHDLLALGKNAEEARVTSGSPSWPRLLLAPHVLFFVLPCLVFYGGLFVWSGQLLPQSYSGKHNEAVALGAALDYGATQLAWLERLVPTAVQIEWLILIAMGALALLTRAVLARSRDLGRGPAGRLPWLDAALVLWPIALELFYRLVSVPFAPWYHLPTTNALIALAAIGTVSVWRRGCRALEARAALGRGPARLVVTALVLAICWPVAATHFLWWHNLDGGPVDRRLHVYREAGELLASIEEPGRVAALEIGFLGWYSRRTILDLGGLVSPEALAATADPLAAESPTAESPTAGSPAADSTDLERVLLRERPRFVLHASLFDPRAPMGQILSKPACYHEIARMHDRRGGRGIVRVLRRTEPGC